MTPLQIEAIRRSCFYAWLNARNAGREFSVVHFAAFGFA